MHTIMHFGCAYRDLACESTETRTVRFVNVMTTLGFFCDTVDFYESPSATHKGVMWHFSRNKDNVPTLWRACVSTLVFRCPMKKLLVFRVFSFLSHYFLFLALIYRLHQKSQIFIRKWNITVFFSLKYFLNVLIINISLWVDCVTLHIKLRLTWNQLKKVLSFFCAAETSYINSY